MGTNDDRAMTWLIVIALMCAMMLGMCVSFCAIEADAAEPVTIVIRDFGKGMTPALPPYRNAPEGIILSQNFFSTAPGGRQLRFGYSRLDTASVSDSGIQSLTLFRPTKDSSHVVYAAGGFWWNTVSAVRTWSTIGGETWKDTLARAYAIRPYNQCDDSVFITGDSVTGFGTRFVRDLQAGDIFHGNDTIKHVMSDTKIRLNTASSSPDTLLGFNSSRYYALSATDPFMLQSGDYLYTGTISDPPQVIYALLDTLRIRPLGVVDSFLIDTIYTNYDTLDGGRRSWDSVESGQRSYAEFQVVSRRKAGQWHRDMWLSSIEGSPESYYVRFGYEGTGATRAQKFFTLSGNDDTSLYLSSWYVYAVDDSVAIDTGGAVDSLHWNDEVFDGHAIALTDTIDRAEVEGEWCYIYSSAGFSQTVLTDASTKTVKLLGRGAIFKIEDTTVATGTYIDPETFYDGMHFIHLTGEDISYPPITNSILNRVDEKTIIRLCSNPLTEAQLPDTEKIIHERQFEVGNECAITYTVRVFKTSPFRTIEAEFIADKFYPIRFAEMAGDTLLIYTATSSWLLDTAKRTTEQWEIVRVGMPYFAGMAEWNTPPQLIGWGDTASVGLLSFSGVNDPWNWTASRDVLVGNNPASPIVVVVGYDIGLKIFKSSSMLGFDGAQFVELSATDGIVGPKAYVKLTNELYWRDVDGIKMMERRDFNGYSIRKISQAMDPVFNSWDTTQFGSDMVPIELDATRRDETVMTFNQRDRHLYVFTDETGFFTYDIERKVWDGYHDIAVTDAIWTTTNDTSRIIFGGPDDATVYAMGYAWNDPAGGIDGILRSAKFFVTNQSGFPMQSKLNQGRIVARGVTASMDSSFLLVVGESVTDTISLTHDAVISDGTQIFYSSQDNLSTYWQWEIKVWGDSGTVNLFQPYELILEFLPVTKDNQ